MNPSEGLLYILRLGHQALLGRNINSSGRISGLILSLNHQANCMDIIHQNNSKIFYKDNSV